MELIVELKSFPTLRNLCLHCWLQTRRRLVLVTTMLRILAWFRFYRISRSTISRARAQQKTEINTNCKISSNREER